MIYFLACTLIPDDAKGVDSWRDKRPRHNLFEKSAGVWHSAALRVDLAHRADDETPLLTYRRRLKAIELLGFRDFVLLVGLARMRAGRAQ